MNRATGVPDNQARGTVRSVFAKLKRKLGRIPPGTRVRALDPQFLRASVELDFYSASTGKLPGTLKHIAQLKVAMMVGCPY
jgi:hypothetical protein